MLLDPAPAIFHVLQAWSRTVILHELNHRHGIKKKKTTHTHTHTHNITDIARCYTTQKVPATWRQEKNAGVQLMG